MTPAIDLIEIIAARGNTTLNSTVQLTVSLRNDINEFGKRMAEVMDAEPDTTQGTNQSTKAIIADMKTLLARIEDAVPLISLALTTSGANLSASLPTTVSPSRLLQASSFLQAGDTQFECNTAKEMQIGPSFSLKLYTIFEGHSRQSKDPNITNITWQETYARAILEVIRLPMQADLGHDEVDQRNHKISYLYHFRVTENLDDGRYHEELVPGRSKRDRQGFIRGASRDIPVHNIARLFFSASGRLLNIEEARTPVLVLKINHALQGPSASIRNMLSEQTVQPSEDSNENPAPHDPSQTEDGDQVQFSPDDLEWLALELWLDEENSDSEQDAFDTASEHSSVGETDDHCANSQSAASRPSTSSTDVDALAMQMQVLEVAQPASLLSMDGSDQTDLATLSLLEYILRLCALQTSEQQSVMSVSDERISLFLRDDNPQSRSRSTQEAEAVRRKSNDRFDTPASTVDYEDFVPGTQVKSRKTKRSRNSTPHNSIDTPFVASQGQTTKPISKSDTPTNNLKTGFGSAVPGTVGSRKWHHTTDRQVIDSPLVSNGSPLVSKSSKLSGSRNPFQSSSDLQSKTNNGFSSRLRHSVENTGSSPVELSDVSPDRLPTPDSTGNSTEKD